MTEQCLFVCSSFLCCVHVWFSYGNPTEVTDGPCDHDQSSQCQLDSAPTSDPRPHRHTFPHENGTSPSTGNGLLHKRERLKSAFTPGKAPDHLSLTFSGMMPRREDLPRPSSSQLPRISRVFKVVFLGKLDHMRSS